MSARKLLNAFELTAVTFVAALLVVDTAWAQQRYSIESAGEGQTSSKYTQQLAIDVGDVSGHQVRAVEIVRTYSEATKLRIMGTRVTEEAGK